MIDVLAQLGFFLPFSRHQEAEADYLGLVFMTIAGYNPDEAKNLWIRMENYADEKKEENNVIRKKRRWYLWMW